MRSRIVTVCTFLALLVLPARAPADQSAPPPPNPVTVDLGTQTATLWPFTSEDLSTAADPINLVFLNADPRQVRQALMALDANRTSSGYPFALFDWTWSDTEGWEQAAWGATEGWTGTDVQLACGTYTLRVHLRLFRQGNLTLGATHFDVQIIGTAEHEVIAWEFPERFVMMDLIRSEKLASDPWFVPLADTGGYFKTGLLPKNEST